MSGPNQAVRLWSCYHKQQQQVLSGLEAGTASKEQLSSLVDSLWEFGDVKRASRGCLEEAGSRVGGEFEAVRLACVQCGLDLGSCVPSWVEFVQPR